MQYWIVTFCRSAPSAIAPSQRLAAPSSLRSGAHDSYCLVRKSCSYVTMPSPACTCAHRGDDDGRRAMGGRAEAARIERSGRKWLGAAACARAKMCAKNAAS